MKFRGEVDKRRKPPGAPRKVWEVTEMWDIHREIARRIALGQKNVRIAEDLNITPVMVSAVRNSPVVKEHTEIMNGAADAHTVDVAQRIQNMAGKALDVLEEILDNKMVASTALKVRAAESILDRSGNSKIQKTQNLHAHLTSDQLEEIRQRAVEKAKSAGILVELNPGTQTAIGG